MPQTAIRRHAPAERPRSRAANPRPFLTPDPARPARIARWGEMHVRDRLALVRCAMARLSAEVADLAQRRDGGKAHAAAVKLAVWSARLVELTGALEIVRERDAAAPTEGRA